MKKIVFPSVFLLLFLAFACRTPEYHEVRILPSEHGKVEVFNESKTYREDQRVILNIKPDEGYELSDVYYASDSGEERVKVIRGNSFWMPNYSVNVFAYFSKIGY